MKGIIRVLIIILVLVVVVGVGGYFLLPSTAGRTESFTVDRPPATVFARLASTPPGTQIAEGVTVTRVVSAEDNKVVAEVAFADESEGTATYTVTPAGDGSSVELRIEQPVGANPLARLQALSGGAVAPIAEAAAVSVSNDLEALPATSFDGLQYAVVQRDAQPFFYIENCSPNEPESIASIIEQAVRVIPPLMRSNRLEETGKLTAVEPRVVEGQYCFQVGYPYRGDQPRALLTGRTGQTPGGTLLRMVYTGTEQAVVPEVYDRMDALLAAAHLDDPTRKDDDWTTFEVYHDDPTQPGGSRNREIFYVVQGDISALTRIAPPSAPAPIAPASAAPAEAGATPPAPAADEKK